MHSVFKIRVRSGADCGSRSLRAAVEAARARLKAYDDNQLKELGQRLDAAIKAWRLEHGATPADLFRVGLREPDDTVARQGTDLTVLLDHHGEPLFAQLAPFEDLLALYVLTAPSESDAMNAYESLQRVLLPQVIAGELVKGFIEIDKANRRHHGARGGAAKKGTNLPFRQALRQIVADLDDDGKRVDLASVIEGLDRATHKGDLDAIVVDDISDGVVSYSVRSGKGASQKKTIAFESIRKALGRIRKSDK